MKKLVTICILSLLAAMAASAQKEYLDSLETTLSSADLTIQQKIEIYDRLCAYYCVNDNDKMYRFSREALRLSIKHKDRWMEAAFSRGLGGYYDVRTEYDSALYYYNRVLDIGMEDKCDEIVGWAYRSLAFTAFRQGRIVSALEYTMKVLEHYEERERENSGGRMIALGNIGELHMMLGNMDRAMHYIERAREIAEGEDNLYGKMQVYYVLGAIHMNLGDLEKAKEFALMSRSASLKGGNLPYESSSVKTLARIHMLMREHDKALEYAQDCLRIAGEMGDPTIEVAAWNAMSDIYREQGRPHESEDAALKAWAIDSTNFDTAPNLSYNIAHANIRMGNRGKALAFLARNAELNRQKTEKSLHETLLDMEVKYETEKKEMKIAALETEKELYVWLGVAGVAILLLVLGLMLGRHRLNVQQRKIAQAQVIRLEQEKQLVAAQALLDGETAERSRLARDLHDGLGGMLSVVKLNLKDMENATVMQADDASRFGRALDMLDKSISELRRVAHNMMPESLIRYGLRVSLEDFCMAIPGASFQYLGTVERLESHLEVLVYRCGYELINNAFKHSGAKHINVQLIVDESVVALTVQDDGRGFDPEAATSGAGLKNIRTRVSAYNGRMTIHSSPDEGTEISVEIELS